MQYRKYFKNIEVSTQSDRAKGVEPPPIQKPYPPNAQLINLTPPAELSYGKALSVINAINNRISRRTYSEDPLSADELSFLLWCTQGIKKISPSGYISLRTVPSGGALHPFETYLVINRVCNIPSGLYRYLPLEHKLLLIKEGNQGMMEEIKNIMNGQKFVQKAALVFIWTTRPARSEWKYGEDCLKDILISIGHVCQNLYLSSEAIHAGTCAIVAYRQEKLDRFLGIDGYEEISLYAATTGKNHKDVDEIEAKSMLMYDYLQKKEYEKAKTIGNEILQIFPKNEDAWKVLAQASLMVQNYPEAEKAFQQVINFDPSDYNSMYNFACILSVQQKKEKMLKWLGKAIQGDSRFLNYAKDDEDFMNYSNDQDFKCLLKSEN